jgi:hypothetical protein
MIVIAFSWRKWLLVALAGVVVVTAIAWRTFRVSDLLYIGTGYVAQQTCACLFVAGRTLDSCMNDLEPLARRTISVHTGDNEVNATSFGVASATSRYEKGFGCSLRD